MKVKEFSIKVFDASTYYITFIYNNKRFIFSCIPNERNMLCKKFSNQYNTVLCKRHYKTTMHYLYINNNGDLMLTPNPQHFMNIKQKLFVLPYFLGFIIFGKFPSQSAEFDSLYMNKEEIGHVQRFPFFHKFGYATLNIKKILEKNPDFHTALFIGNHIAKIKLKFLKSYRNPFCIFGKKYADKYILIRTQANSSNLFLTVIPFDKLYNFASFIKIRIAKILSYFFKKSGILLYEKLSSQAEESGYYVFEKLLSRSDIQEKAYFVLDKNSSIYDEIKRKYPDNVLSRLSFRHFFEAFRCKLFMSSEFPTHVFSRRLFDNCLTPLSIEKQWIFLQHGIMFAKPIENPAARGFYKSQQKYNLIKTVISSELEAGEFYKAGYDREDLIKCGLPKFDVSKRRENADKILFMPTYRYWEEAQVLNQELIATTTYFKLYERIIAEFKKRGLIDRLLIAAHPFLNDALREKLDISPEHFPMSINTALEEASIFITDFSSASYDAHYRGAYIIYYWEERKFLEDNYKATAPINAENCDGIPVYSVEELFDAIASAEAQHYIMPAWCEDNYKKINEFHDNHNADRLIDYLKNSGSIS